MRRAARTGPRACLTLQALARCRRTGDDSAAADAAHGKFVVVVNDSCEGFQWTAPVATKAWTADRSGDASSHGSADSHGGEGRHGSSAGCCDGQADACECGHDQRGASEAAAPDTVRAFLQRTDAQTRWADHDWFLRLLARCQARLQAVTPAAPLAVRKRIAGALAVAWYDFDALAAARIRPLRSWARARACIEAATEEVLAAVARWSAVREEGAGEAEQTAALADALRRASVL